MKKKVLIIFFALLFILPCAFGFTACANKNGSQGSTITGIEVIIYNNFNSPNYYSCEWDNIDGNKEAFTMDDVKVYYTYSTGKISEIKKGSYSYKRIDRDGSIYNPKPWAFMETGETSMNNPGTYKMRFYSKNEEYSVDLVVEIYKAERPDSDLEFIINKYTDYALTEYSSTEISNSWQAFKINYAQHIFDYLPYFFSASGLGLKDENIKFFVIEDCDEYYEADDKTTYIRNNKIGICNGTEFTYTDGTPLLPGDYLVVAQYDETFRYTAGYSKPARIKILPGTITSANTGSAQFNLNNYIPVGLPAGTQLAPGLKSENLTYNDLTCFSQNNITTSPIKIPGIDSKEMNNYILVNFFDGTEWQSTSAKQVLYSTIKVHAYKTENNKYFLADYADGKWYKFGTTIEVPSNTISYVDYINVEDYINALSIESSLYLTVDVEKLSDEQNELLQGFTNLHDIFKIDIQLKKQLCYLNDDINIKMSYDSTTKPNGLTADDWQRLKTYVSKFVSEISNLLYTIDYTGIENLEYPTTAGQYTLTITLYNNPNLALVTDSNDYEEEYVFLGQSFSVKYSIIAK